MVKKESMEKKTNNRLLQAMYIDSIEKDNCFDHFLFEGKHIESIGILLDALKVVESKYQFLHISAGVSLMFVLTATFCLLKLPYSELFSLGILDGLAVITSTMHIVRYLRNEDVFLKQYPGNSYLVEMPKKVLDDAISRYEKNHILCTSNLKLKNYRLMKSAYYAEKIAQEPIEELDEIKNMHSQKAPLSVDMLKKYREIMMNLKCVESYPNLTCSPLLSKGVDENLEEQYLFNCNIEDNSHIHCKKTLH